MPDKLAVCFGETTWTYREFDAICNRLANGLLERGRRQGDRVAILARNSHAFAALRFALARIGAVLVPINFMLNAEEAAYILRHAGASAAGGGQRPGELGRDAAARDTARRALLWLPRRSAAQPPPACRASMHCCSDDGAARTSAVGERRPGADRLHQRHRIAAQGRDADPRRGDLAVRELHRRRRDRAPTT